MAVKSKAMRRPRSRIRRVLKGVACFLVLLSLLYLILAWIPFARLPDPDADALERAEALADEMQRDVDTGDRAMLLRTGADGLDARLRLISQASREVVIVTYECHDDESTRDVLAAALERADAGVRVRFLVDGIAGRLDHMAGDLFCAMAAHPNVEIRFYNLLRQLTPWRHMGRMHDKYVIVDDTAYILGGRNMFDKFLGDYPTRIRSVDREVLVFNADGSRESSLHALRDYFEGMWVHRYTDIFDAERRIPEARRDEVYADLRGRIEGLRADRPELFERFDYAAATVPTRGIWLVANPTNIYAKSPTVFSTLCALMQRARHDVVLHSPYAVLNGFMREELTDAAGRVPVTLMVNAVENGANVVASSDYLYHRDDVLSTGVRLLEYAGGDSYHGKAAAIDDQLSLIGSYNLDMRSTYIDTELMLVVRGRAFNAMLRENMDALHADCREVIAGDASVTPEGLDIPAMALWKRIALRILGALLQPVRNLV